MIRLFHIGWWLFALALTATAQEADEEPEILGQPAGWAVEAEDASSLVEVAEGSALHAEPDHESLIITLLPDGQLPLVESNERWVRVRYGDRLGWVDLEAPHPPQGAPAPSGEVFIDREPVFDPLELGTGWTQEEAGPYTLFSRVDDPGLIDYLLRVAVDHARLYAERYGLPEKEIGGMLILLADRQAMTDFRRARGHEIVESRIEGYFHSPDLVVLYRGFNSRQRLAATVIHEVTHLVSWQVLRGGGRHLASLPPWLEEGMAEELALSSLQRGRLRAGPLGPGNLRYGRRLGAVLWQLEQEIVAQGTAPSLPALLAMDEDAFLSSDSELNYLMSAFWVRYLLSGADDELAAGFKAYLASVAGGGGSASATLLTRLDRTWPQLSNGFRGYLVRHRTRLLQ